MEIKQTKKEEMMKHSIHILTLTLFLAFALPSFGTAQMTMGGSHGNMPMGKADTTSQPSAMMGSNIMPMMKDLSGQNDTAINDFNKLESHFNTMMKITDMDMLKAEMKKHQDMMQNMHKDMMEQEGMIKNMMSSIQMNGMMKETSKVTAGNK